MFTAIFGAQGYATGTYLAIKELYPDQEVICFLVSERGINAESIDGIPVRILSEFVTSQSKELDLGEIEVLIATPDNIQDEIERDLVAAGFKNVKRMDFIAWNDLMRRYHKALDIFRPLPEEKIDFEMPVIKFFMARSEYDRNLSEKSVLSEDITSIQVGASISKKRMDMIGDDTGSNISEKNRNYSELTALYWIWKNKLTGEVLKDGPDYYGLVQYRRLFILSDDEKRSLAKNDVDVLLPYPLAYDPNISAHHMRYLKEADWQAVLKAVEELVPDYAKAFPNILNQRFLYNYNIILAKAEVLSDYCEWLFPILFRVEELSDPKGSERADRYIGYVAETLETLYFMHNSDKLNIFHTGSRILY